MNPHSTYANLSDEERAGLDARGPITTRAGAELLAFWQMHRYMAHGVKMDEPDALPDDIAKVERQAVAAYKTGLAEAVRALESPFDDARLSAAYYAAIADVAALLEDKAKPSGGTE